MHTLTFVAKTIKRNFLFRLYKYYIIDSILIARESGFKELIRQRGIKVFVLIFCYYLVRDSLIYVVIPFCIARGLF